VPDRRPPLCPRCEQEGTCPRHLFERRAREAGIRPAEIIDVRAEYVTQERAAALRVIIEADRVRDAIPVPPPPERTRELTPEELTWNVRGEPRARDTFGQPHPLDFPGGLPIPPECPLS